MAVTSDTVLVWDAEPIARTLDDKIVVLSVRAGFYFDFNTVGSEIWAMLTEPRSVGQLIDSLSRLHNVDADTVTRDVTPFLQTLIDRRLLRILGENR